MISFPTDGIANQFVTVLVMVLTVPLDFVSRDVRPVERERGAQRRPPNEYSRKRLLFTIAITGIAVLLGSLFYQRKADNGQLH